MTEASGVVETSGVIEASGTSEGSGVIETSDVTEASGASKGSGVVETSGMTEASGVVETSGVIEASGVTKAPGVVPGVGSDPGTNSCDGCGVSTFCPVSARAPFASGANAKKRRSFKQLPTIMISTMSSIAPMRILNFFAVIFFFIFWPPRAAPYASFLKTCFVCFSLSIYHSAASCAAPCEREASRSACPFSVSPSCK